MVENHFLWDGALVQTLEHYFEVELDRDDVISNEPYLEQVWLPAAEFAMADVRPRVVRDALGHSDWRALRRLSVQL